MRKNRQEWIREIEARTGKSARDAIRDAIETLESIDGAAEHFGIPYPTFYYLLGRLGIETKTITVPV